ncbi:MAG: SCO1664 family protein [Candidatus Rokubacteria bacterium]|nr:SCO1664 family protein [Candidatus Rokubacteria bacterium]
MPPATSARGATATSTEHREREVLARGAIGVKGRLPYSSNATFLVEVTLDGRTTLAVYKPRRGERPLWDFPPGLYRREIAAYRLSEALGWGLVPLTLAREDGPLGEGSLQQFVPADFEQHYFTLREDAAHHGALQRICAFDLIANNADRKSGHCLLAPDGRIYAIDNGLCFHADPKLRTVIWDFGGAPLPEPVRADLRRLVKAGVQDEMAEFLDVAERDALLRRATALIETGVFPADETGMRYPWPLV